MLEFLARFPRFNGFLLGILQGIPQGLVLPDQDPRVMPVISEMDRHWVFLISFGLLAPLVYFLLVVVVRGDKRTKLWTVCSRYVDLYGMMFWACLSLSAAGFYALNEASTRIGYGVCALFAASGLSLLVVGFLEERLQNKKVS